MLLTNLNVNAKLVNGSRGIISGVEMYSKERFKLMGEPGTQVPCGFMMYNKRDFDAIYPKILDMLFPPGVESVPIPLVTFRSNCTIPIFPHAFQQSIRHPNNYTLVMGRIQFPLAWAWAITIHKSQGASLDYVVTNLENVYLPGQAYVALSRARDPAGLQITGKYTDWSRVIVCDNSVKLFESYLERGGEMGESYLYLEKEREKKEDCMPLEKRGKGGKDFLYLKKEGERKKGSLYLGKESGKEEDFIYLEKGGKGGKDYLYLKKEGGGKEGYRYLIKEGKRGEDYLYLEKEGKRGFKKEEKGGFWQWLRELFGL